MRASSGSSGPAAGVAAAGVAAAKCLSDIGAGVVLMAKKDEDIFVLLGAGMVTTGAVLLSSRDVDAEPILLPVIIAIKASSGSSWLAGLETALWISAGFCAGKDSFSRAGTFSTGAGIGIAFSTAAAKVVAKGICCGLAFFGNGTGLATFAETSSFGGCTVTSGAGWRNSGEDIG